MAEVSVCDQALKAYGFLFVFSWIAGSDVSCCVCCEQPYGEADTVRT